MVGATIIDITYGFKVLPKDDPHIQAAEAAFTAISQALRPGAFLVDQLPILRYVPSWVPGAGFQKKAKEWKKTTDKLYESAFLAMKEAMVCVSHMTLFDILTHRRLTAPQGPVFVYALCKMPKLEANLNQRRVIFKLLLLGCTFVSQLPSIACLLTNPKFFSWLRHGT